MRQSRQVMLNLIRRRPFGRSSTHLQLDMKLTFDSIKKELARLERNKERRHAREKQKGIFRASAERDTTDPNATPAPAEKPIGTTRKCANCGQAGHIKTNKKYCHRSSCRTITSLSPPEEHL